jgi:hypothetical protein
VFIWVSVATWLSLRRAGIVEQRELHVVSESKRSDVAA